MTKSIENRTRTSIRVGSRRYSKQRNGVSCERKMDQKSVAKQS